MTLLAFLKIAIYFLVILALTKPAGLYMRRVFSGERTFLDPVMRPIERFVYRLGGVDSNKEHDWKQYTIAMLVFNVVGLLLTYAIQRLQHVLPLNSDNMGAVASDLAWNTATSFATNTNWQAYVGESTMSHFSQMVGLTFHNFASAATGIALAIALIRGIARTSAKTIGNFWVDLVRCTLWILLPLSLIGAVVLMSQGVVQNFHPAAAATTIQGKAQHLAQGPVASQEAIKELGTNGGRCDGVVRQQPRADVAEAARPDCGGREEGKRHEHPRGCRDRLRLRPRSAHLARKRAAPSCTCGSIARR